MHVHLVGGDVNVRIDLVELRIVSGFIPDNLKNEVMAWLAENQNVLIKEWKKWQK
jgi:hypothetical protein